MPPTPSPTYERLSECFAKRMLMSHVYLAVPAALLDGKNKPRLLWAWMDALEQSMTSE